MEYLKCVIIFVVVVAEVALDLNIVCHFYGEGDKNSVIIYY